MESNEQSYIYVLQLEQDKYYVGRTDNVDKRFQEHLQGNGSAWTCKYKPVQIEKIIDNASSPFEEDKVTKEYMSRYGVDSTRGGSYITLELGKLQLAALEQELRMATDVCIACGKTGHFVKDCYEEFNSGADPSSYSLTYLVGNFFGLTKKKTSWCKYCNKEFVNDDAARLLHQDHCQRYQENKRRTACFRCGRQGHGVQQCYATTHIRGYKLR